MDRIDINCAFHLLLRSVSKVEMIVLLALDLQLYLNAFLD